MKRTGAIVTFIVGALCSSVVLLVTLWYWWDAQSTELLLLGQISEIHGGFEYSLQCYQDAGSVPWGFSASELSLYFQGREYYRRGEYQQALEMFRRLSVLQSSPMVLVYRGRSFELLGEWQQATLEFQQLLERPEWRVVGYEELAQLMLHEGDIDHAVEFSQQALFADEMSLRSNVLLGLTLLSSDLVGARLHLERVERSEKDPIIHAISPILEQLRLLDDQPELEDVRFSVALSYSLMSLGQYHIALRILSDVLLEVPEYRDAYRARSLVYELLGDPESAAKDRDQVLRLAPIPL